MTLLSTTCLKWLNNLMETVPEKDAKNKLDKIIKEEMGHIKILINDRIVPNNE